MATISTLAVNLVARTRAFEKGMRRSQKRLRAFAGSARKTIRSIARIGMVGSVAAVGLGYLVKKQMDFIDSTGKLARRIGMSTENLVGLQHAAELSGVSTEGLNKAMETFVRRLGETRLGVGQAAYALDMLGLSADKLVQMTPAESFRLIADRINRLSNQADKAAAAYYLMGRQGMQMLNMIKLGGQGLLKVQRDAERLGLTFTMQQALKVEAANDALYRMKQLFVGVSRTLTIELAPVVEQLADRFTDWATSGEGIRSKLNKSIEDLTGGILSLGMGLDAINLKWKAFRLGAIEGKIELLELADAMTNLDELFTKQSGWTYKGLAEQARQQAKDLQRQIDADYERYEKRAQSLSFIRGPFAEGGAFEPTGAAATAEAIKKQAEAMEKLRKEADRLKLSLRSPLEVLRDFSKELKTMFDIGALSGGQIQALMVRRARQLWDFTKKIETKMPAETRWQFIRGQGMEFDPSRISPAALARGGTWIQSAEVSELKTQTTILKATDQKIAEAIRIMANQQGWN